jgi:hypothetical protein
VKGKTLKPHHSDKQDPDPDPHQSYTQDPDRDPHEGDADPHTDLRHIIKFWNST